MSYFAVQLSLSLFCLFSLSYQQPPPPPGPPRPIISKSFVSLISVNYTTLDGTTKFNGVERYAVNAWEKKRVLNITDNDQVLHTTQLYLFNSKEEYTVQWNENVTGGDCALTAAGEFEDIFEWVEHSSLLRYDEFLDWTVWGYSDNGTEAILVVPADNPNVPVSTSFKNDAVYYNVAFLNFEAKQPPERFFDIPLPCSKPPATSRGYKHQVTTSTMNYDILSMINSNILSIKKTKFNQWKDGSSSQENA